MKINKVQNKIFFFLCFWLIIASLYYAPNLIEGQLLVDRDENIVSRAAKYVIGIFFLVAYIIAYKDGRALIHGILLGILLIVFAIVELSGYNVTFGFDVLVVLLSFYGMIYIASRFNLSEIDIFGKIIIYSGFFISIISYFEYSIFESILGGFWDKTGGFRSVSTLLNPNNLGIYLSAALILLFFSVNIKFKIKLVIGAVVVGALFLSGSRTAWFSLIIATLFGIVYRGSGAVNVMATLRSLFFIASIAAILFIFFYMSIFSITDRMSDPYTFLLRIEKQFQFLYNFGIDYLYPDLRESRVALVSESGYLHLINSLGLLCAVIVLFIFLFFVRISWIQILFKSGISRAYSVLILFYFIASFFENILMSFPNNQLFFLVVGVLIASHRSQLQKNREFHCK